MTATSKPRFIFNQKTAPTAGTNQSSTIATRKKKPSPNIATERKEENKDGGA